MASCVPAPRKPDAGIRNCIGTASARACRACTKQSAMIVSDNASERALSVLEGKWTSVNVSRASRDS